MGVCAGVHDVAVQCVGVWDSDGLGVLLGVDWVLEFGINLKFDLEFACFTWSLSERLILRLT